MKKKQKEIEFCHLGQGSDESSEERKLWRKKKLQAHDQNSHHCIGGTLHHMVALLYMETEDII